MNLSTTLASATGRPSMERLISSPSRTFDQCSMLVWKTTGMPPHACPSGRRQSLITEHTVWLSMKPARA